MLLFLGCTGISDCNVAEPLFTHETEMRSYQVHGGGDRQVEGVEGRLPLHYRLVLGQGVAAEVDDSVLRCGPHVQTLSDDRLHRHLRNEQEVVQRHCCPVLKGDR